MAKAKTSTEETVDNLSTDLPEAKTYTPLIYGAMLAIMGDMDAIVKKKQSSGVTYAFRSIDDVMNTLHPLLVKHGVFIVPILRRLDNRVFEQEKQGGGTRNMFQSIVESAYQFTAVDGSFVEAVVGSESTDWSDKATQQALSYCFKIAVLQSFCVPTKELFTDGDERTPAVEGKQVQSKVDKKSTQPATVELMSPEAWATLKKELADLNVDDTNFHHWTIKNLRALGQPVPVEMKNLPKAAGRLLFPIAQESKKQGKLLLKKGDEWEDITPKPKDEPKAEPETKAEPEATA